MVLNCAPERAIRSLQTACIKGHSENVTEFLNAFSVINEAQSKYFRRRFIHFLSSRGVSAKILSLEDIIGAFYLNYVLSCMGEEFWALMLCPPGYLPLEFSIQNNPWKKVIAVGQKTSALDAEAYGTERLFAASTFGEALAYVGSAEIQNVVAVNTLLHEVFMGEGLPSKLSEKSTLSTIVYGEGFQPPRGGARVRRHYKSQVSTSIDISSFASVPQSFLSIACFH